MSQYFKDIGTSFKTLTKGLKITFGYLKQSYKSRKPYGIFEDEYFSQNEGLFTLQYPHEMIPVPDNGRYRLHNEIDDCIVCDKCAKVCPVDCIDIEPIRATETIGLTSDGTPKRIHAAKFDIDMSKCCFCGLCTTVCPTECLTMTKTFDFSEEDVRNHNYSFSEMSLADIALKQKELEEFQRAKEQPAASGPEEETDKPAAAKPKPTFKPKVMARPKPVTKTGSEEAPKAVKPKVVVKPKVAPKATGETPKAQPKPKVVVKPKIAGAKAQAKPVVKPKATEENKKVQVKPKIAPKQDASEETPKAKARPVFKPRPMVPKKPKDDK